MRRGDPPWRHRRMRPHQSECGRFARHHRCTSPDVYEIRRPICSTRNSPSEITGCARNGTGRACPVSPPNQISAGGERGCETQTRARDEHMPATFPRRANRARHVDGAKRGRSLPARHLDASLRVARQRSGVEDRSARFPNVSTPSQRSMPPRTDTRAHDATQSDSVTCAPRRRDVGIDSSVNG